jgi:RNA polymerase sigma-70 factor (ECF subfamily)
VPDDSKTLALYMAHRGALVNYASGIVGDRAHAEDLVQEAWLRFFAAAGRRPLDEPVGYLYRVVRNLAVDGRRRLLREGRMVEAGPGLEQRDIADAHPSPEAEAVARDELRRLTEALAELPERTRIALEMRRFGGCKLKEIASHLGVSVSVAHDIVAAGIAHCRRRVRPPA